MSKNCIICRMPLLKPSDEHIFPTAIGGSRITRKVCIDCNNQMGTKIDTTITEHIVVRVFREQYNLAGQSGNIPNFFDQIVLINGDPNKPAKLCKTKNGEIQLKILPQTKQNNDKVTITIDSRDIQNLEKIKHKIFTRQKSKGKNVSFTNPIISTIKQPHIEGKFPNINLINYKIGFLKIAYEFACDVLPQYFEDENAKEISKILYTCDVSRVEAFVIHSDFEITGANFLKVFGDFKNQHTIHLLDNEYGLLCYVTVFDSIYVVVKLSEKNYCEGYKYMLYNNYVENNYWMRKFNEKGFEDR